MSISKILYNLFFGVVLLIVLFFLATQLGLPGQWQVLVVQSGSMEPAIKTGGAVLTSRSDSYKVGDVITFTTPNSGNNYTTHRIVDIEYENGRPSYTTKGDANDTIDGDKVKHESIVGEVRLTLPYIGYLIEAVKKPIGFAAFVIIPSLVVIYSEILKIAKVIDEKRKNKIVEKLISEEDAKVS